MIGSNQCEHGSLARQCLVCELTKERDQALELLRRVEFVDSSDGEYWPRCGICQNKVNGCSERGKHAPDCELAALIGGG